MTSNSDDYSGTDRNDQPGSDCHCGPSGPGCENMIFLGKLPDMDPYEGNVGAEKAVQTLGGTSHGTGTDPLYRKLVEVHGNDLNEEAGKPVPEQLLNGSHSLIASALAHS